MVTKHFNSLLDFSEHLIKAATSELFALQKGLVIASELIKKDARDQIGNLQSGVGPFPEWEELAESTKDEKERLGYVFNDDYNPLYRTGKLLNSIDYEINMDGFESIIGSDDQVAAFQEFGTKNIPPRPFIGSAAFKHQDTIAKIFGIAAIEGIAGGNLIEDRIGRQLGYILDIKL